MLSALGRTCCFVTTFHPSSNRCWCRRLDPSIRFPRSEQVTQLHLSSGTDAFGAARRNLKYLRVCRAYPTSRHLAPGKQHSSLTSAFARPPGCFPGRVISGFAVARDADSDLTVDEREVTPASGDANELTRALRQPCAEILRTAAAVAAAVQDISAPSEACSGDGPVNLFHGIVVDLLTRRSCAGPVVRVGRAGRKS